ncbi:MAG: 4-hydroxy-tetrahydrodipicolinate reductase [Pseudomonadota bacterium]
MSDKIRMAVLGAAGRMGQMLIRAVTEHQGATLSGVTERPGHDWVGADLGEAMGGPARGVMVSEDPLEVFAGAQAVIDFTSPKVSLDMAALAAQARAVHVIGTTGFSDEQIVALQPAQRHAVQIRAGNMSRGVNLLTQITRQVAAALGEDFDIEVVEMHHRHKVDAPSGTALMLGQAAAEGRGVNLTQVSDRGRDGLTGARNTGDIGFAALRGGDVAGEHDVVFAGHGERIVLRHVATDRMIFARGAISAAVWGQAKPPGGYTMLDVLGLD